MYTRAREKVTPVNSVSDRAAEIIAGFDSLQRLLPIRMRGDRARYKCVSVTRERAPLLQQVMGNGKMCFQRHCHAKSLQKKKRR